MGAGRDRMANLRRLNVLLRSAGIRQGVGRGSREDVKLSRWPLKLVLGTFMGLPVWGNSKVSAKSL